MPANTPDLTLAQIIAGIATLVGVIAGAVTLSGTWPIVAVIVGAFVVLAAWVVADAIIRHGRSRALTPTASATVQVTPTTTPPA